MVIFISFEFLWLWFWGLFGLFLFRLVGICFWFTLLLFGFVILLHLEGGVLFGWAFLLCLHSALFCN